MAWRKQAMNRARSGQRYKQRAQRPMCFSIAWAVLLGNRSVTFALYDYHLRGVSARELATAYSLPLSWVEERLEAVRLCVKYQVKLSLHAPHTPAPAQQLVA